MTRIRLALMVVACTASALVGAPAARATLAPPPPGCNGGVTSVSGTTGPINDALAGVPNVPATTEFTASDAGPGTIYDVELTTQIRHPNNGQLSISLVPPSGPTVVIARNAINASGIATGPSRGADVFDGTVWDDHASVPPNQATFTSGTPIPSLEPQLDLGQVDGTAQVGTWRLDITDFRVGPAGTAAVSGWTLRIAYCMAPVGRTGESASSAAPVPTQGSGVSTSTIEVSSLRCYVSDLDVRTDVSSNSASDVTIALTSPEGTTRTLASNDDGLTPNAYHGVSWDDQSANKRPSEALSSTMEPDQALAGFTGEDPNGAWTLTVRYPSSDPVIVDGWSLAMSNVACPSTDVKLTGTAAPTSVGVGGTVSYTLTASNAGGAEASNVVLTDALPAGLVLVSAAADEGSCAGGATVRCGLGRISPGSVASVTVLARATQVGQLTDSASVAETQSDTNPANNTATIIVIVTGPSPPAPSSGHAPVLTLTAHAKQKLKSVLMRGVHATVQCDQACTVLATLLLDRKAAKQLHLAAVAKPMVIGRARLRVAAGKTTKLIVKLSRRARAEFRVLTTVKLTLSAVATDSAGHRSATKIRRIILSR